MMAPMTTEPAPANGLPLNRSPLVAACLGEPVPHTPVWFMRQAGRSLPEYRALRAGLAMLESCRRPDLVCEITLQPVRRHGVDAAILFSDIVVPLHAAGVGVEIQPGVGPVVAEPVRALSDLDRIPELAAADVAFVAESVRLLVAELGATPLIGFAGAPFTLASYLVEGGPSKHHVKTKALMYGAPDVWNALCARLTQRIHFGVDTAALLPAMGEAGAEVVGVDWRTPLDRAASLVGDRSVQGNLDPAVLFAPFDVIEHEVRRILDEGRAARGHVFNLGHGVLPETDPDVLTRVVDLVHKLSAR